MAEKEKRKDEEKDTSLGKTALLLGSGAVLAVSALDGGVLTMIGYGAMAYGSYWLASRSLEADEEDVDSDRFKRDLGVSRFIIAGACGIATFLNPFIGIPGTLILLWARANWKDDLRTQVERTKETIAYKEKKRRKKDRTKQRMNDMLGLA